MTIKLPDDLEDGYHSFTIPVVVDGLYAMDIEIGFSSRKGLFSFDLKTVTDLILVLLSLIPLLFILYTIINIRRLGISITHPRIIVEFCLFLFFFAAGLIVVLI
jgi:hypothetical protein